MTAAICLSSTFAAMPQLMTPAMAHEVVYDSFEANYDGWHGSSAEVELSAVTEGGIENSRGMKVSNRISPSDGASSSKGFYLTGGVKYDYSVKVYSETDETFHLSLLYIDEKTEKETVVEIASETVRAGEWTEISASYKAPADTYEYRLTITTDSTNDFSFDDVKITSKTSLTAKAAPAGKGLKDEFADYFRVGNILNGGTVKNSAITANIIKDCNSVECENETKPDATLVQSQCSGTNIGVSLNSAAAIMDFCVKNNIGMRGHTLVWHSQTPEWFFKDNFQNSGNWVSSSVMDQRMENYIKNLFAAIERQYPDLDLYAYDVANECVSDDSNRTANNGGSREPGYGNGKSPWVQVYGNNSFVEKAFVYARKYAPEGCDLYYNDYNEYWDHKRDSIYNMCKSLYSKGLLDGVGMQSHVPANATGFAGTDSYIEAMKKYLSIGCDVQITELDISVESGKYSAQDQANKYKAIFQAAMDWNKNPKSDGRVTLVAVWGPNDANSWLSAGSDALLYDKNNQPKLAYTTLTSMIPDSQWGDGSNYQGGGTIKPVEPNEFGWYFQCGFEDGTDDWSDRGGNKISQSSDEHYTEWGENSLLVSDRTSAWQGASFALNPRAFEAGKEYSFSAHVKQRSGENVKMMMKIEYTDGSGETAYSEIASATTPSDTWVQLENTNYKIPDDATNVRIYIETEESLTDFYIDEVIGAVAGTGIMGEGQPEIKVVIPGDTDFDGTLTVFDLIIERKCLIGKVDDALTKKAADVDQSGKVEVNDLVLLQEFLLGKIDKFPVAEKVVDTAAMEAAFKGVNIASSYKKEGEGNPLYTQRFGADPGVMEYNGRVYVYMTNDVVEYDNNGNVVENTYGKVNKINCISSDDMVNWTDHGAIQTAGSNGVAKWASLSWAPCAAHKTINGKEKFFLYFCNGGNGVCVVTADSPTGPWSDPLGHELVTRAVPNCNNIPWLFDPAVFVDDDGTGYLCFGGGVPDGKQAMPSTTRVVKLGADMISLDGTPSTIDAPYVFEDSGINKIGNKYYYTYCSNWSTGGNNYGLSSAGIQYMVADNPMGPYKYGGELFKNQGNFFPGMTGNNHHSIVNFKNQLYLFYHSRPVEKAMGIDGNYRSPQVDKITMNGEKIGSVTGTMAGIAQLKSLNVYSKVQAETMSNQSKDISVNGLGDTVVHGTKGSWIKVSGADLSKGVDSITAKASAAKGGVVKFCAGSPTGDVIGYAEFESGSSMKEVTMPSVSSVSGKKDIYIVFSNDIDLDYWYFS